MEKLKLERNRGSTRKNYYSIWKKFNQFFIQLDEKPESWEERIILFVGYLVAKKLKANTNKSYISAVKGVLKSDGIEVNEDRYLISSLTRACKYRNDYHVRIRAPIKKNILEILLEETDQYFGKLGQPYLMHLYQAIFMAAYYGMLRVSEIGSGQDLHPIKATDVHIGTNKNKMLFVLRTSKTHWRDEKPQFVKITSLGKNKIGERKRSYKCPFETIRKYADIRPDCIAYDEPFFVFADRSGIKPSQIRNTLKVLLKKGGFDPSHFSTHSFRIGRSLQLKNLGLSIDLIKSLGCWSSNCVYTYLAHA